MKNHTARWILFSAIGLGVLGNILLNGQTLGINLLLLMIAGLATTEMISWDSSIPIRRQGRLLMWLSLLFGIGIACRTSVTLTALNFEAIATILVLVALRCRTGQFLDIAVTEYVLYHFAIGVETVLGFVGIIRDSRQMTVSDEPTNNKSKIFVVVRGVAFAAPLILIFGALFCSADAVFSSMVSHIFQWNFAMVWSNIWVSVVLGCLAAGALRAVLLWRQIALPLEKPEFASIGTGEMFVVLGLMNALFFAFVTVQFRFLFGSHVLIDATPGLTYTQYARGGFFELVAVTLLVLPTLLGLDWFFKKDNGSHTRVFRGLNAGLIVQLFIIMLSALHRMQLYVTKFGLTELRLYSTGFMIWLALVFIWFLMTVLVGKRQKFIFGALISGLAMILAFDVINPDAVIVHYNRTKVQTAASLDSDYLEGLSADSVPELVKYIAQVSDTQKKQELTEFLKQSYLHGSQTDWRSWNWSKDNAARLVKQRVKERERSL